MNSNNSIMSRHFKKHERSLEENCLPTVRVSKKQRPSKRVVFVEDEKLENVCYYDPFNGHVAPTQNDDMCIEDRCESQQMSKLTEELTFLSTLHGQARRELRDISKHDLKTVLKYGVKTPGRVINGERRWKFEFGNTIFITDEDCTKEITCYKKPIEIGRAKITDAMMENHNEVVRVLRDDPHLCTSHSVIIVDQSGSMRACDVNCFRSRSDAAFGTLALDYIAEQLYQQGGGFFVDAVTIIEMNDTGSILFDKEPLDWILFNKVLDHMKSARPRSHGNYTKSLHIAANIINRETALFCDLDKDDIPAFALVFISDGKPSDNLPEDKRRRRDIMTSLSRLNAKISFLGMGIGASGADFAEMENLADIVTEHSSNGSEGTFVHAGLNPMAISTTLTSIANAMTTTRNDQLSAKDERTPKEEKAYTMRTRSDRKCKVRRETSEVKRYFYDPTKRDFPWRSVEFINKEAAGFEVEINPFGRGAERLAHFFHEIKHETKKGMQEWIKVGRVMVAKESRYFIENEETKEKFHTSFCKVQFEAQKLAIEFNKAVKKAPLLKPSEDEVSSPPPIQFLKCSIYEYVDRDGVLCGLLVEKYLNGKFTKYNGNNGYVNKKAARDSAVISLAVGEVKLTDFVQAFSHWVYVSSGQSILICDLQGILDLEGRRPIFCLTDPVICSKGKKRNQYGKTDEYGKTDLGMQGIRQFCRSHKCNGVCKGLNLPLMRSEKLAYAEKREESDMY